MAVARSRRDFPSLVIHFYFWTAAATAGRCSFCQGPALFVSGPGAPSLCRGPALCVGARRSLCRGPAVLSRRSFCRGPALCVGARRSLCRGPALCVGAGAPSLCRGPALCVGARRFCVRAQRSLRRGPALLSQDCLCQASARRFLSRSLSRPGFGAVSGPALCVGARRSCVGARRSLCRRSLRRLVSGPGALCRESASGPSGPLLCHVLAVCASGPVGMRRCSCQLMVCMLGLALFVSARRSVSGLIRPLPHGPPAPIRMPRVPSMPAILRSTHPAAQPVLRP